MSKVGYQKLSRRMFIQGMGGTFLVPLLPSLLPREARAQAAASRKRFVAITTPNQFPSGLLFPANAVNPTLPSDLQTLANIVNEGRFKYRTSSLDQIRAARGQVSNFIDSSMNDLLSKISIYRGVDMPGRIDHGRAATLGNIAASHLGTGRAYLPMKTMDEYLAASARFYEAGKVAYHFPIMRLGESGISTSMWDSVNVNIGLGISGNNGELTLNGNLNQIFEKMFESRASAIAKAPVIDRVHETVRGTLNSPKIGSSDRRILTNYLELISQLSLSLKGATALPSMAKPNLTFPNILPREMGSRGTAVSEIQQYYSNIASLIFLAMQSDSSRIFTIGISSALISGSESITQDGSIANWHGAAHANDNATLFKGLKYAFDRTFVDLLRKLDTPEAGGQTYLDNTLLSFQGECSNGHSGVNHGGILAGNASGLVHGNAHDFADWSIKSETTSDSTLIAPGQPINRLWVGILKSLGLQPSDYLSKFGNNATTFGIWERYKEDWEAQFGTIDRSTFVRSSLPGLFKVA